MNKNNTTQPINYSSLSTHIGFEEVDRQNSLHNIANNSAYKNESKPSLFLQHHIDSARYATNDNNPFHDPIRWMQIKGNPFGAPVVMGFQLAAMIENKLLSLPCNIESINNPSYPISNYRHTFIDAVKAREKVEVITKTMPNKDELKNNSYRIRLFKNDNQPVMLSNYSESKTPLYLTRSLTSKVLYGMQKDNYFFHKRVKLDIEQSRSFLLGSLANPAFHYNQFSNKKTFSNSYLVSLISSVLISKFRSEGDDINESPAVFTQQSFSIDRNIATDLEHEDFIDIFAEGPCRSEHNKVKNGWSTFKLFAMVLGGRCLYRAEVTVAPVNTLSCKCLCSRNHNNKKKHKQVIETEE